MPNASRTEFGNLNVKARVDRARRRARTSSPTTPKSTLIRPSPQRRARIAALQDAYIANQDMLVVDGWIGNDP